MADITKWKGSYTYGENYPAAVVGTSVEFEMEWTEENGQIRGTSTENGENKNAVIEGVIEQDIISFEKTYPCLSEMDDEGNTTLFENEPSQEIHYTGKWIQDHYEGKWEIVTIVVFENGDIAQFVSDGTWVLYKQ